MKKIKLWIVCFFLLPIIASAHENPITLKQKIGQMLIFGFNGENLTKEDLIVKAILQQEIGGVILFDFNYQTHTFDKNIKDPTQLRKLTQELQSYAQEAAVRQHNQFYPLLISIDYEGGHVNRLKEQYGFPKTLSSKEIGTLTLMQARHAADQMAKTLKTEGFNLNFAPVLDVEVNPNSPAIGKLDRCFSKDAEQVARYGAAFSKAYYEHGILCTYKHFPGHGSSTKDSHRGFVDVTNTCKASELQPYRELLAEPESCPLVMMAHIVNRKLDPQGYPASLSKNMVDLLRNQLNFKGVIISDDMQMKAITENYKLNDAVKLAINAGVDILIFGNQLIPVAQDPKEIVDIIYNDVITGQIPEQRINEAYEKIIQLKGWVKQKDNKHSNRSVG